MDEQWYICVYWVCALLLLACDIWFFLLWLWALES